MRLDVARRRRRDWAPIVLSAAAIVAILLLGWQVLDLRHENDRIQKQVAAADADRAAVTRGEPGAARAELPGGAPERHRRPACARRPDGARHRATCWRSICLQLDSGIYELWGADSNGGLTALGSMEQVRVSRSSMPAAMSANSSITAEPSFVEQPTTTPIMQGTVV